MYCARAGIDYVGLDLPVVAEDLRKCIPASEGKRRVFVAGDATNGASLMRAADMLDGELLISCEGLLHYLTEDEAEQLIEGIQRVLSKHGGAWVTSDFAAYAQDVTDDLYENALPSWNEDKKLSYLEFHGMSVEVLPAVEGAPAMWRMAVDPSFVDVRQGVKQIENLTVDYRVSGTRMLFMVQGRIDSVGAPVLLSIIDGDGTEINAVTIDATKLDDGQKGPS